MRSQASALTNLRLGVESSRWSALVYVDNVADDRTIRSAGTGPGTVVGYFRVGPFLTYTLSKYDAQTLVDSTVSTADLKSAKGGFLYYGLRVRVDP